MHEDAQPRPPARDPAQVGQWGHGWQFYASDCLYRSEREALLAAVSPDRQAILRSGSDAGGSRWLNAVHSAARSSCLDSGVGWVAP